ncbi:MAG: deoxynucleoside kinase [Planctomycetota bacterium]
MSATLVSIIGPPAAGKTTLAEALAARLGAEVIYEDYAGNPFLAASYAGEASAKLPAQLYYLMSRVGQLALATWPEAGLRVSDYGFCHDRMYARRQLDGEDWELYDRLARRVEPLVKPPDLLVGVDAGADELARRIARRGRRFERSIDRGLLQALRDACLAEAPPGCPALRLSAEEADFRDAETLDAIAAQVRRELAGEKTVL